MEDRVLDLQRDMAQRYLDAINAKIDDLITEGLRRKGYTFETRYQMIRFIRKYCRCEISHLKEKKYFVKEVPFLLFVENIDVITENLGGCYNSKITLGAISFL